VCGCTLRRDPCLADAGAGVFGFGSALGADTRDQQFGTWPNGFVYIATEGDARKLTALMSATKDAPRRGKLLKDFGPRRSG
jgi:hypothetical protein